MELLRVAERIMQKWCAMMATPMKQNPAMF